MSEGSAIDNAAILVVDDNPLIVNVLKSLLGSAKYQVYTCNDGKQALETLQEKQIDVIICDVMMPVMDGYRLQEQVREQTELSHIPFVFLTALDEQGERARGRESGADDYLTKPFDPVDLLALVKGKIARSRSLKSQFDSRYDSFRKKIIHTLSHEFRTPLVAINTGTELLLDHQSSLDPSKAASLLEAIKRGGQRLERLVSDFMLFQQIEAGIPQRLFESRVAEMSISQIIAAVVRNRQEELNPDGFAVHYEDLSGGAKVSVYEPHIADIVSRLIANAVKFSGPKRSIDVVVIKRAEEVAIDVRDRGIGFDPKRVQEAIDVFGQIDRDRFEQQGGGMGLAIANRYAVINRGRLEFEQREGGGSVVSLVLPCVTQKA